MKWEDSNSKARAGTETLTVHPYNDLKLHVLYSIVMPVFLFDHMATHSFKGQKAKNGAVKPKLGALYTTSLIGKF